MKNALLIFFLFGTVALSKAQTIQQTIRGQVFDKISKKTLTGATVTVLSTSLGNTTDDKGHFRIANVSPGRYTLKISFLGYEETQIPEVVVNAGKEVVLEVGLQESVLNLLEVNILPERSGLINPVSNRTFTIEEVQRFPGNYNDPARLVTSYPGVANTNDQANNLTIRGNSPNGMLWRLEGVDIVNPNHLSNAGTVSDRPMQNGGGVNILSMQLLGNSQFLTGAFQPGYGNALAGVMDMRLRKGNNEHAEFTTQASLIGIDLAAEGPLSKHKNASFLVNYRYSFTGLLGLMGIKFGDEDIAFQDLSFNFSLPTKNAGNFTVFGFGGTSRNVFEAQRDKSKWQFEKDRFDIEYRSRMGAGGLTHELSLGKRAYLRTVAALSMREDKRTAQELDENLKPILGVQGDDLTYRKLSLSSTFIQKWSRRQQINIGLQATQNDDEIKAYSSTLSTANGVSDGWLLQPFITWKSALSERLNLQLGLHALRYTFNQTQSLEPRASLHWQTTDRSSLTFAYGLHSQLQGVGTYQTRGGLFKNNENLGFSKAHHYVMSYSQLIGESVKIKAETYYQSLFNIPVSATRSSSFSILNQLEGYVSEALVNSGTGHNKGLELSVEQFLNNKYYYLVAASVYDSKYKGSDGILRNTRFNGNYQLSATGGKEIMLLKKGKNRVLGINLRTIWQGGFRDTPIDAAASKLLGRTVYKENEAFTTKLADYYRFDLRVSFKKHKPHYTRTWAIDIQNLTSHQNVAYQYYDVQQEKILTKTQLGIIPILSYRVEF